MIFTFLGKIVAALSVLAGLGACVGGASTFSRLGEMTYDPANPFLILPYALWSMGAGLIIFGLLLGVFCEISSNLRRLGANVTALGAARHYDED